MRLSLECLQISMVDQCVITIKGRENITYTNGLHLGTRSADQNKQTTLIHLCIFIRDFTSTMVYLVEVKNGNEMQYLIICSLLDRICDIFPPQKNHLKKT